MIRIALISDIHGNWNALQAVLQDIAQRGVDQIVNLGDSLSGPLLPHRTAEFLMRQDWVQLAGNHERQILFFDPETGNESDRYARSQLNADMLGWLASLPATMHVSEELYICHGTPVSDLIYLLDTVESHAVRLASAQEIEQRLGDIRAKVMACGHTHMPHAVRLSDGTLIVNPGSVGLPAFDDAHPFPHVMETGSPDARYAIVEERHQQWSAALYSIPYDYRPMAELARHNKRPDWEYALLTGYAYRPH